MGVEQTPAGFSPNPQQRAAFDWVENGDGSANIVAYAGTGKTTTAVQALRYMEGTVHMAAFGKEPKGELVSRVKDLSGIAHEMVTISTVHASGLRAWGRHNSGYKLTVNKLKVRELVREFGASEPKYHENATFIARAVNFAKQSGFGVLSRIKEWSNWEELIDHFNLEADIKGTPDRDELIAMAIQVYETSLKSCKHEVDMADMLLAPLYFKAKFPTFDWLVIDEAQDISPLRLALLSRMVKRLTRVIAVGDPYQAIYGFTGADSASMDSIKERFNSIELPLSVSYRCPKVSIAMAREYVPDITSADTAPNGQYLTCWLKPKSPGRNFSPMIKALSIEQTGLSEPPQTSIWDLGPFTAKDAILCRNNRPLVSLAYEFLKRQIPAIIEGRDSIGAGLLSLASHWVTRDLNAIQLKLADYRLKEVAKWKQMKEPGKAAQVEDQVGTLLVLIEATQFSGGTTYADLERLVDRMFGDTPEGERPKCLTLSSIHKAKGREWYRVFILGRARYMPSRFAVRDWEKEQERHLVYVALTRNLNTIVDIVVPD